MRDMDAEYVDIFSHALIMKIQTMRIYLQRSVFFGLCEILCGSLSGLCQFQCIGYGIQKHLGSIAVLLGTGDFIQ